MENTEGNGGPQADFVGERELFTHCQLKEVFIKLKQVSEIIRKLKKKYISTDGHRWMSAGVRESKK